MIVHHREPMNVDAFCARSMPNNPEEDFVVLGIIEDLHAIDSPVHDVDAQALDVDTKGTRHVGVSSKRRSYREFAENVRLFRESWRRSIAESAISSYLGEIGNNFEASGSRIPVSRDPGSDPALIPADPGGYRASSTGSVTNDGSDADRKTLCVAF